MAGLFLASRSMIVWLAVVGCAAADDELRRPAAVITPENVTEIRLAKRIPGAVYVLETGPGENELTFLEFLDSLEVVDDGRFLPIRTIEVDQPTDVAVSADGRYMAWSQRGSAVVVIHDVENDETIEIEAEEGDAQLAFSPRGDLLAVGETVTLDPMVEGSGYSFVTLFDATGMEVQRIVVSTQGYGAITPVFSPDGSLLAVGNRNYETRIFEVDTGELRHVLPKRMTQQIAFSPDGTLLAAGYVNGDLALWDVETGDLLDSQSTDADETYSVDWNPAGDLLVRGGNKGDVVLWEPGEMSKLVALPAPDWVIQVRFSPDGKRLYTAGGMDWGRLEPVVEVWTVPDHEQPECSREMSK